MRPDRRFPPNPAHEPPWPSAPPLDVPIVDLLPWALHIECEGCKVVAYPFRLMAAERGWKTTLRAILAGLKCGKCGRRPSRLALVDRPDRMGAYHAGGSAARVMELKEWVR